MNEPEDPDLVTFDEASRPTIHIPIRRGDGIFSHGEYADVDADNADHWDARQWHDRPR